MAIPLVQIDRLEEFEPGLIEHSGNHDIVQYRGELLPLFNLSSRLGMASSRDGNQPLPVIVYSQDGQAVGLIVEEILDIVEDKVDLQRRTAEFGVLGSAVIQGKVTDMLDVHGVVGGFPAREVHEFGMAEMAA